MRVTLQRCLGILVLLWLCRSAAAATESLVFATTALPPYGSLPGKPGFLEQIGNELARRLGLRIEVTSLPGDRPLINANAGLIDGDMFRAPGMQKQYPNLMQIPEAVDRIEFMAYSLKPEIIIRQLRDLQPYSVAYALGWKFYEKNVKAHDITVTNTIEDLFTFMAKGRADVILADRWQGLWEARRKGFNLRPHEPPLASVELYMYLHKRHASRVPKIAQALAGMKADGSYQRIHAATLEAALGQLK